MIGARAALLGLLIASAACGGRPAPVLSPAPPIASPVDVDALIRRGCYRCLEEAFTLTSVAGTAEQAFEASILLVLRSKELGLPPGDWLRRAQALLPAASEWATYLEIVSTYPRDPLSGDRDVLFNEGQAQRRSRAVYEGWRQSLQSGPGSPLVRGYLDLSIACRVDVFGREIVETRESATAAVMRAFGQDVPLLQYRIGLCGGRDADQLEVLGNSDPGFVDAELVLARRELARRPRSDFAAAVRRFRLARAAFPQSPVIPATLAAAFEAREQWAESLAEHEAVLTLVPTHRDALLGQTVTLSNLTRYEEARAAATRLIDLGSWHLGPAFYWRGWNQLMLERFAEARADVDRAKTLWVNPAVFLLSGMIEWELKRPASAETEFQEALQMDFGQCEAASYLGGVRLELRKWPESLAAFQQAQQCYDLSLTLRRQAIATLSATPEDAVANAWQIASHERAIAAAERRRAEATQNVAAIQKFLASR